MFADFCFCWTTLAAVVKEIIRDLIDVGDWFLPKLLLKSLVRSLPSSPSLLFLTSPHLLDFLRVFKQTDHEFGKEVEDLEILLVWPTCLFDSDVVSWPLCSLYSHLDPTDHWKSGEESQGAPDDGQPVHERGLGVLRDQVERGAVDGNRHHVQVVFWLPPCKMFLQILTLSAPFMLGSGSLVFPDLYAMYSSIIFSMPRVIELMVWLVLEYSVDTSNIKRSRLLNL